MIDTVFYINKGPFSLKQVSEITGANLSDVSKSEVMIKDIATMEKAQSGEICFF